MHLTHGGRFRLGVRSGRDEPATMTVSLGVSGSVSPAHSLTNLKLTLTTALAAQRTKLIISSDQKLQSRKINCPD